MSSQKTLKKKKIEFSFSCLSICQCFLPQKIETICEMSNEQQRINRMQDQIQQADNTERGLKIQIIKHRDQRNCAIKLNSIYSRDCCALVVAGVLKEDHVWTLVENQDMWKDCMSASVGVLTTIGDYTNKKGVTMKVHYSENGHFIEKCKKGDEEPKSYEGHFKITKDRFRFVMNPDAIALTQLFVGRVEVVHGMPSEPMSADSDDEAPLSAVAKKITKKLTIRMKKQPKAAAAKNIVFCCADCNKPIVENSEDHDNCYTEDGDTWWCEDCRGSHEE